MFWHMWMYIDLDITECLKTCWHDINRVQRTRSYTLNTWYVMWKNCVVLWAVIPGKPPLFRIELMKKVFWIEVFQEPLKPWFIRSVLKKSLKWLHLEPWMVCYKPNVTKLWNMDMLYHSFALYSLYPQVTDKVKVKCCVTSGIILVLRSKWNLFVLHELPLFPCTISSTQNLPYNYFSKRNKLIS